MATFTGNEIRMLVTLTSTLTSDPTSPLSYLPNLHVMLHDSSVCTTNEELGDVMFDPLVLPWERLKTRQLHALQSEERLSDPSLKSRHTVSYSFSMLKEELGTYPSAAARRVIVVYKGDLKWGVCVNYE